MLGLAVDVVRRRLALRLAHTERTIAFLPRKARHFVQPSRGISFELLHSFGQRNGRRQRDEQMQMIGSAASGQQRNVFLARDSADVLPEPLRIGDEIGAVFGAEDAMHEVAGVGMRHVAKIVVCD